MAFTENLKVEIESLLDAKGFQQLDKNLTEAKAKLQTVDKAFDGASGIRSFRRQVGEEAEKITNKVQRMDRVLEEAGLEQAPEKMKAPFLDPRKNYPASQTGMGDAERRIMEAQDRIKENRVGRGSIFGGQIRMMGDDAPSSVFDTQGLQRAKRMRTPEPRQLSRSQRAMLRFSKVTGISNNKLRRLSGLSVSASAGMRRLSGGAKRAATSLMQTSVSLQTLQMQLLGVQFSLLSLAFIFGGLMGSALGAVGIFKILGNTLKQFFLPAALSILPLVLDLRDALLSIDSDTRESIGRIFMVVAAVGALGSIMAFAASGVLGFLQGVGMLLSPLGKLIFFFTEANSVVGLLSNGWAMLVSAAGGVMSALAAVASFVGFLVAGFKVVDFIINQVSATLGVLLAVLATVAAGVLAFTSIVTAPFWIVAGAVGAAIGAILAVLWNFRDTVWNILTGIAGFFIGIFEKIFNILVGNSIIPDMVDKIIEFLTSIPSKLMNLGANIVDTIVQGIKNTGSAIWNAFKKILPDFLVDAIEGAGDAVKGIVDAGGDIVGSAGETIGKVGEGIWEGTKDLAGGAMDAAGNFASGVGNAASNLNPLDGNNGGNQKNVQQNNVDATVQVNDKEETPQETGRQFGQGLSGALNSRQSDISSGT